jgi:hypothetical protein
MMKPSSGARTRVVAKVWSGSGGIRRSIIAMGARDGRDKRSTENAAISSQDEAAWPISSEDPSLRHAQKDSKYHAGGIGTTTAKDHFAMPTLLLHHRYLQRL